MPTQPHVVLASRALLPSMPWSRRAGASLAASAAAPVGGHCGVADGAVMAPAEDASRGGGGGSCWPRVLDGSRDAPTSLGVTTSSLFFGRTPAPPLS
jgi:hypothetical protein